MANHDFRTTTGATRLPSIAGGKAFHLSAELDCAENNVGAGEIAFLLSIPAKTFVKGVVLDVLTAEGAASTVDVGDYTDVATPVEVAGDGYLDGANANSVAASASMGPSLVEGAPNTVSPVYGLGKFYATGGCIGIKAVDALDAAKFRLTALCEQIS